MHRLRSTWLALAGGAILVTLSVSAAFGAPPTDTDGPRGQKVSDFVHELVFGPDEQTDEDEVVEEEPAEEDEDGSEETEEDADENVDEETDEDAEEDSARQVPEEFANHGECVSAAAHDTEGFEASEAANKGEWVSMHARYVCWGLEVPGDETDEAVDEDTSDEEEDASAASAREQAKADRAAARAERKAERATARAERHAGKNNGH